MSKKRAFNWIIDILESNNIPYLICGGLAAIAYGSVRELNDIDIYVSKCHYKQVSDQGGKFITFGPERYEDKFWSVDYVQFTYAGQKIEVGSDDNIRIFNSMNNCWEKEIMDFSQYSREILFERDVKIMKKNDLIAYKNKLGRTVDQEDIRQIRSA